MFSSQYISLRHVAKIESVFYPVLCDAMQMCDAVQSAVYKTFIRPTVTKKKKKTPTRLDHTILLHHVARQCDILNVCLQHQTIAFTTFSHLTSISEVK